MIDESIKINTHQTKNGASSFQIEESVRSTCKKIAPLWSLQNFVAVNPYLGLSNKSFKKAAYEMALAGGIEMTLPSSFYLEKIEDGSLLLENLSQALEENDFYHSTDVNSFIQDVKKQQHKKTHIHTAIDVASISKQKDLSRLMVARVSIWAASYFDESQAVWTSTNSNDGLFLSWKTEASIDKSTEILGLIGFRNQVKSLPKKPMAAIAYALEKLHVPYEALSLYLHRLLLKMGGWAAYAARIDWDNELKNGNEGKLVEFLAVLISWEVCLFECIRTQDLEEEWKIALDTIVKEQQKASINTELEQRLILQKAFDYSMQKNIVSKINQATIKHENNPQALAQAIFCIDVRSEVYRRNLETIDKEIETFGFAGFFGFPIEYIPIGHEKGSAQCPVLIKPSAVILEKTPDKTILKKRINNVQIQKIWKGFKSGAITCFSFVSPIGLSYLPKLFTDSFGLTRPIDHPDSAGMKHIKAKQKNVCLDAGTHNNVTTGIPLTQQIELAYNALKGMSLTENFAQFVLIVGHGSSSVNNPYATGLDCGACAGHSGEANAKVAAAVLNNREVRKALIDKDLMIPENTIFLACLHDTATDELHIFNEDEVPLTQKLALNKLKQSLDLAGHATRAERSLRMNNSNKNIDKAIIKRSKDWSQIRPEWGLAGCSSFIVAPREKTKNIDLEGKAFLHSYSWEKDADFTILELIMTAPMVVTSWISLQYYASTVDNEKMGAGNKTLHNITAGLGVLEGYSGDLRVGLPFQSIHDGEKYQHEPIKLNVIINAPIEAMNKVLKKNNNIKDLCDNEWIHLLAMNNDGKVYKRYVGDLNWEAIS